MTITATFRPLLLLTWCVHVMVSIIVVLSMATGTAWVWVDAGFLGRAALPFMVVWMVAVLAVPLCAGPRVKNGAWVAGVSRRWGRVALGIASLMPLVLMWNLGRWQWYWWHDSADDRIPLQVPMLGILTGWLWLSSRPLRRPLAGPVAHRKWQVRGAGAGVAVVTLALMVQVAWIYTFSRPLPAGETADAAVVLGTGLRDNGSATEDLADRVRVAIGLYREGRVKKIVLSGAVWMPEWAKGRDRNETGAMRQECLMAGIPDEALVLDPVGFNTRATAIHTLRWMKEQGYTSVVICTSPSHLLRTARTFASYAAGDVKIYAMPSVARHFPTPDVQSLAREVAGNVVYTLSPKYREPKVMSMSLSKPRVVVSKREGVLRLFDGGELKKTYTCISGGNAGDKSVEGDRKTPEGSFRIVFKNPLSKFHLSLGLDYPNKEDAARGLAEGLITKAEHDGILEALGSDLSREENQKKLWYTKLGGEIFIHGHGEGRTGTAGCIAVSNKDVEELYAILPVGTEVVIEP